jgi:hypothetical protein
VERSDAAGAAMWRRCNAKKALTATLQTVDLAASAASKTPEYAPLLKNVE